MERKSKRIYYMKSGEAQIIYLFSGYLPRVEREKLTQISDRSCV